MTSGLQVVEIEAPAKVNLVLRVLGQDGESGYHEIETIFQAIGLSDVLRIGTVDDDGIELSVEGADVGPHESNLVMLAARSFLEETGIRTGLRIRLVKRIPHGAGLGGGSSDAAATLRALEMIFAGAVGRARLVEIGAELGSDVAFFLGESPTAVGLGRGERLRPLPPLPVAPVLVIVPDVHVSTGEAYRALDEFRSGRGAVEQRRALADLAQTGWNELAREAHNDFQPMIVERHPAVADMLQVLDDTFPRMALLSGSGSAVFAVYQDEGAAEAAERAAAAQGWHAELTSTLTSFPPPAEVARRL